MKHISYLVDFDKRIIEVFENPQKAMNIWSEINKETDGKHLFSYGHKKLKNYYGTIWYAFKWNDSGSLGIDIKGRWKDIKHLKEQGYTIKKKVFQTYKEFNEQFEEKISEGDIQDLRDMLDSTDLSKLEEETSYKKKRISPGFS